MNVATLHPGRPRAAAAFGLAVLLSLSFMAGSLATAGVPGTLVVLNKAEASASLIDLASGEVVATLPTGVGPHEVAASYDGGP